MKYARADSLLHYPFQDSRSSVAEILESQAQISPGPRHGVSSLRTSHPIKRPAAFCEDHVVHLHHLAAQQQENWLERQRKRKEERGKTNCSESRAAGSAIRQPKTPPKRSRKKPLTRPMQTNKAEQQYSESIQVPSVSFQSVDRADLPGPSKRGTKQSKRSSLSVMDLVDDLCDNSIVLSFMPDDDDAADIGPPPSLHQRFGRQRAQNSTAYASAQPPYSDKISTSEDDVDDTRKSAYSRLMEQLDGNDSDNFDEEVQTCNDNAEDESQSDLGDGLSQLDSISRRLYGPNLLW
mmetsp:Transcript_16211/g.28753  ORF Transcript_16211/g.28753 Transcript_16211/m.28753 type:complete len:293 (-) Transcript_16211:19-897(-)